MSLMLMSWLREGHPSFLPSFPPLGHLRPLPLHLFKVKKKAETFLTATASAAAYRPLHPLLIFDAHTTLFREGDFPRRRRWSSAAAAAAAANHGSVNVKCAMLSNGSQSHRDDRHTAATATTTTDGEAEQEQASRPIR